MASETDLSIITEGSCVIVRKLNGSRMIQIRVKKNVSVSVENLRFKIGASLIGKKYGVYNVKNGFLEKEATKEGNEEILLRMFLFRDFRLQERLCIDGWTRQNRTRKRGCERESNQSGSRKDPTETSEESPDTRSNWACQSKTSSWIVLQQKHRFCWLSEVRRRMRFSHKFWLPRGALVPSLKISIRSLCRSFNQFDYSVQDRSYQPNNRDVRDHSRFTCSHIWSMQWSYNRSHPGETWRCWALRSCSQRF